MALTARQAAARLTALRAAIPAAARQALTVVGGNAVRYLKEHELTGGSLGVRSGRLRNSVGLEMGQDAAGLTVRVFAGRGEGVNYAGIHEHGGTITPKRGRFLAIPVGPARTPSGVARGGWESPRTAPVKLRFVPIRGGSMGRLVIDRKTSTETAYLLVRSVRIKPKHFMARTQALALSAMPAAFSDRVKAAIVRIVG